MVNKFVDPAPMRDQISVHDVKVDTLDQLKSTAAFQFVERVAYPLYGIAIYSRSCFTHMDRLLEQVCGGYLMLRGFDEIAPYDLLNDDGYGFEFRLDGSVICLKRDDALWYYNLSDFDPSKAVDIDLLA